MTAIHVFEDSHVAYDASQCLDNIHDGDVLVGEGDGVRGVLVEAWPVAVSDEGGCFHRLEDGVEWDVFEGGRYADAARIARDYDPQTNTIAGGESS